MSPVGGIGGLNSVSALGTNPASQVRSLRDVEPQTGGITLRPETGAQGASFKDTLTNVIGEVNDLQLHSENMVERFAAGEVKNLHEVIIAQQEASIAFRLVQEVRNKLLESYQDIMRTQV
jgi:flagellar hook-basal body complex protein FliE